MFIQTETTPNPETLKFLPGRIVLSGGGEEFRDMQIAKERSLLATKLFLIPGIATVFFGYDFISVTKKDAEWNHLKPVVLGTIMEHFVLGLPVLNSSDMPKIEEFFDAKDSEIVAMIKELLEKRIRPAIARDGGNVTFHGFREGILYLEMQGACSGCPSSAATLKHGIENLLCYFIPEIVQVKAVSQ